VAEQGFDELKGTFGELLDTLTSTRGWGVEREDRQKISQASSILKETIKDLDSWRKQKGSFLRKSPMKSPIAAAR